MAPHDPLFKRLLRVFFADFLRLVAPAVAEQLDPSAALFLDKEFPLPGPPERSRIVDLLARVPLRREGTRTLTVHIEIEARARRGMGARLQEYHPWIQTRYPGQILSVVVYLRGGRGGVREEVLEEDIAGPGLPSFRYLSFGLERCQAAEYLSRPEPLAWTLASLMKPGAWTRPELKLRCLLKIANAPLAVEQRFELVNCVENYLQLTPRELVEYASLEVPEQGRIRTVSSLITWSDRILFEGQRMGARQVLLRILERRFGPVPEDVRQRVGKIRSFERLSLLAEQASIVKSLKALRLG